MQFKDWLLPVVVVEVVVTVVTEVVVAVVTVVVVFVCFGSKAVRKKRDFCFSLNIFFFRYILIRTIAAISVPSKMRAKAPSIKA